MDFNASQYIDILLNNFAKNHAYYNYLKLKKCKSNAIYLPPNNFCKKSSLNEGYELSSILKTCSKNIKKVTWNSKLYIIYNY